MNQQYYHLYGDLLVNVIGDGGRTSSQYDRMYDEFKVSAPGREPELVIEETTDDVNLDRIFGDPDDCYGWTGNSFVVRNGSDFMAVEPGWGRIEVTPGFEPFYSIYPMEFEIRRRLIEDDMALVHASSLRFNDQTILFPAWRSAGKTNTLLSLLREGADFLSDDRLWVGKDGSAMGYPLGVNLHPRNVESFPNIELDRGTPRERIRHEIHEYIDDRFDRSGPLPETAIAYLNDTYFGDDKRTFSSITSLYPTTGYVSESSVDSVVILQTALKDRTITAEPVSTDEAVKTVTSISNFEWDGRLREYFHAYDALVDGDMVETLDEVICREREVFRELFEKTPTYRAHIPREGHWNEHGLDRAIVDVVSDITTETELASTS